jgi:hypothetical protein
MRYVLRKQDSTLGQFCSCSLLGFACLPNLLVLVSSVLQDLRLVEIELPTSGLRMPGAFPSLTRLEISKGEAEEQADDIVRLALGILPLPRLVSLGLNWNYAAGPVDMGKHCMDSSVAIVGYDVMENDELCATQTILRVLQG